VRADTTSTRNRRCQPLPRWIAGYEARWVPADLVADVTLAAYAIPVSLAYATLAELPPVVGLYGYLLGGLGYAALGSSRHLAVGPTSALPLLVGAAIAPMAAGDPVRLLQIASLAAFEIVVLKVTGIAPNRVCQQPANAQGSVATSTVGPVGPASRAE
jgi:MFS superfamily sulfate permease-like transporter